MTEARRYRSVVSLQAPTITRDALGEPIKTWSTIATYRAEVRGLTGREQLQAGQINATLSTAVVHRFVDDDAPGRPLVTHRYLVGSRVLVIVSVFDLAGDRRELKALCTEAAA